MIDEARPVRKEDRLDEYSLGEYLKTNLDSFHRHEDLIIKQFSGGASNLTYLLQWRNNTCILRTSPKGANIKSAHDMVREHRVLSLLRPHFNYAPKPLHLCEDDTIIGRPFYLMEKVEGLIPRKEFPGEINKQQARELCHELIDVHVALHEIDINETGLIELGYPQGYIERQITGWNQRYQNALLTDSLKAEKLRQWLVDNKPNDEQACLIHNDYKFDNVVLSPQDPTKIIAVLDWEMTTVGSALMDLGCSMAYWIQKDDSPSMQAIRLMPTHLDGMMTREQIVDYYAKKRGIKIDDFNYYYIFGLFRLAVIVQQIYKRYAQGTTHNPAFKPFGDIARVLITQAENNLN